MHHITYFDKIHEMINGTIHINIGSLLKNVIVIWDIILAYIIKSESLYSYWD